MNNNSGICPRCGMFFQPGFTMGLGKDIVISDVSTIFGISMCTKCWKELIERVIKNIDQTKHLGETSDL